LTTPFPTVGAVLWFVVTLGLGCLLFWLVITGIRRGSNGARIFLLIAFAFSWLPVARTPEYFFSEGASSAVTYAISVVIQIAMFCLMFSKSANQWFRRT